MKTERQFNKEIIKIIDMFSLAKFTHMKIDLLCRDYLLYGGGGCELVYSYKLNQWL